MGKHWQVPREHGAWGMLYIPLVLGLIAAGGFPVRVLLLIVSATFAFLARAPLQEWIRARHWGRESREPGRLALAYLAVAAISGLWLLAGWGLWGLVYPAAIGSSILVLNLYQSVERTEKTLPGEILAASAMALTGPAAHHVVVERWTWNAGLVWALSIAFFISGILYVKLRISGMKEKEQGEQQRLRKLCGAYHLLLLVSLAALWSFGLVGLLAALAFLPVIARGVRSSLGALGRVNLKRAGWLEVTWSVVFLALAGLWLANL